MMAFSPPKTPMLKPGASAKRRISTGLNLMQRMQQRQLDAHGEGSPLLSSASKLVQAYGEKAMTPLSSSSRHNPEQGATNNKGDAASPSSPTTANDDDHESSSIRDLSMSMDSPAMLSPPRTQLLSPSEVHESKPPPSLQIALVQDTELDAVPAFLKRQIKLEELNVAVEAINAHVVSVGFSGGVDGEIGSDEVAEIVGQGKNKVRALMLMLSTLGRTDVLDRKDAGGGKVYSIRT
jgi:hypothetical protein